jgi:hypothetical protein
VLLITASYTAIFWGLQGGTLRAAFETSGSSLFTLGFVRPSEMPAVTASFTESALGPALVALLVSYLPSIYSAFTRRETAVTLLEVYAGTPASAQELLLRASRIHYLARLDEIWRQWQVWFADVEESHTSLPALCFFRSPHPDRSWITSAGCVLDAAALWESCLAVDGKAPAALCIRSGFLALRRIADYFSIAYDPDPSPDDPITIDRAEFDDVWDTFEKAGLPLLPDRDAAWRNFAGWRVNYDTVLVTLATLVDAPIAPWSSDRGVVYRRPPLFLHFRNV